MKSTATIKMTGSIDRSGNAEFDGEDVTVAVAGSTYVGLSSTASVLVLMSPTSFVAFTSLAKRRFTREWIVGADLAGALIRSRSTLVRAGARTIATLVTAR